MVRSVCHPRFAKSTRRMGHPLFGRALGRSGHPPNTNHGWATRHDFHYSHAAHFEHAVKPCKYDRCGTAKIGRSALRYLSESNLKPIGSSDEPKTRLMASHRCFLQTAKALSHNSRKIRRPSCGAVLVCTTPQQSPPYRKNKKSSSVLGCRTSSIRKPPTSVDRTSSKSFGRAHIQMNFSASLKRTRSAKTPLIVCASFGVSTIIDILINTVLRGPLF